MTLKTFQFTLKGFDGSTSDTDHLIKWVRAESQAEAKAYALNWAGWDFESVEEIPEGGPATFEAGLDVILTRGQKPALPPDKDAPAKNPNTNCLEGFKCPECGSFGTFSITCTTIVEMTDSGSEQHGDIEWEDDSCCRCSECSHVGTVKTFTEGTGS